MKELLVDSMRSLDSAAVDLAEVCDIVDVVAVNKVNLEFKPAFSRVNCWVVIF
jgi:hypothetical protein